VAEGSAVPGSGRMAYGAVLREARRRMIGIRHRRILFLMTGVAVLGRSPIHAADMAAGTSYRGMSAGQGKGRRAVVEVRRGPGSRRVADGTILRQSRSLVVGVAGGVVLGQMARDTRGVQAGIFPARMTILACTRLVGTREWESCPGMIVSRSLPSAGRMTE